MRHVLEGSVRKAGTRVRVMADQSVDPYACYLVRVLE